MLILGMQRTSEAAPQILINVVPVVYHMHLISVPACLVTGGNGGG